MCPDARFVVRFSFCFRCSTFSFKLTNVVSRRDRRLFQLFPECRLSSFHQKISHPSNVMTAAESEAQQILDTNFNYCDWCATFVSSRRSKVKMVLPHNKPATPDYCLLLKSRGAGHSFESTVMNQVKPTRNVINIKMRIGPTKRLDLKLKTASWSGLKCCTHQTIYCRELVCFDGRAKLRHLVGEITSQSSFNVEMVRTGQTKEKWWWATFFF